MRIDNSTGKRLDFYSVGQAKFDSIPAFKPRSTKVKEMTLYQQWLDAKAAEKKIVADRRAIEDQIIKVFNIPKTLSNTQNVEADGFKVKIVGRLDRKVNSIKLQDLAAEYGLTDHLSSLFRWTPEVNVSAWESADPRITAPLLEAITTSNGRPSFTIVKE
jgi:hypothetical protein